MKPSNVCLPKSEIPLLLSGDLPPEEAAAAESHIAECESCRSVIESMIADSCWWDDARHSLAASATHVAASLRDAEGSNPDVASLGETRLRGTPLRESVLNLLGPTDDPNMLGRIGSYEIIGLLGQGGMGAVFKGFDRSLNRFVAIKMLLPHLAASGAARKRFAREGKAVAAVVDDHVMAIHCVDEWQGVPYLVMTYSRGVSLQKRLSDNGPLEVREILRIGMQAAKGLAAAHAQGIVHRDIKPANIFLDQNVERVQLMDFGLARAVDDASLTRSGTLAGTPQYMSPEQARAETVDHRSDLFSLGSVMYTMCTGHSPFRAESSYSVLRLITDKEPRPIREINPDVPEWLSSIIGKLMTKQASNRFASAKEIADLLEQCLAHVQQPEAKLLPDAAVALARKMHRLPPIGKFMAAAAFAFALASAGVLIVLELNKGTSAIQSDVDDVRIHITGGGDMREGGEGYGGMVSEERSIGGLAGAGGDPALVGYDVAHGITEFRGDFINNVDDSDPLRSYAQFKPAAGNGNPACTDIEKLHEILLAFHQFAAYFHHLPKSSSRQTKSQPPHSWRVAILPLIGYGELYQEYQFAQPWDSQQNLQVAKKMPELYRSAQDGLDVTSFKMIVGGGGFDSSKTPCRMIDITDGTSNTIALIQADHGVPWTKPEDCDYSATGPVPTLSKSRLVGMADGNALELPSLNDSDFRALITRAAGELVTTPQRKPSNR